MLPIQALFQATDVAANAARAVPSEVVIRWSVTLVLALAGLYLLSTELGNRRRILAFWAVMLTALIAWVWLTK